MPGNRNKFDSIALPCFLSPEEQSAFDRAMRDCYIDTCDEESLKAIMQNTVYEKLLNNPPSLKSGLTEISDPSEEDA